MHGNGNDNGNHDDDDDDDDDDEIILVSSIQKRWEKLHGIDNHHHRNNHKLIHQENGDNEDDDIVVITVRPAPAASDSTHRMEFIYQRTMRGFLGSNFHQSPLNGCLLFTGIFFLIWWTIQIQLRRKQNLGLSSPKGTVDTNNDIVEGDAITAEKTTTITTTTQTGTNSIEMKESSYSFPSNYGIVGSSESSYSNKTQRGLPQMMQSLSSSNNTQQNQHKAIIERQKQTDTLEMARQFVQDVKLVEEVLAQNSVDPSIASQLAVSLQSSQHIVDSQREMFYQKAMLDVHQKQLDRHLSNQQHQETKRASKYDPNWNEKLLSVRDDCYYWNSSNGGVIRLCWEILLIQQLVCGILPVWQQYSHGLKDGNSDEIEHLVVSFLKDTGASVFAQLCDCQSPGTIERFDSTIAEKSYSMFPAVVSQLVSLRFDVSGVTSKSYLFVARFVQQAFPASIDHWTCYGYCIVVASVLLFGAILCHQGLRILSLPSVLHHVLNLSSIAMLYGPQRTLRWILGTLMKMVLVLPVSTADDEWEQQPQNNVSSSHMGCSLVLLSLWVLLPLWSWNRTSKLYREAAYYITKTDPVDFEASFRTARFQLKQWYGEQMAMRYVLLSLYSTLVLWENSHTK